MNIYVYISKEKQKGCIPNNIITFRGVRFGRMGEDYFFIINRLLLWKKQKEPKWKNLKGSTENGL